MSTTRRPRPPVLAAPLPRPAPWRRWLSGLLLVLLLTALGMAVAVAIVVVAVVTWLQVRR